MKFMNFSMNTLISLPCIAFCISYNLWAIYYGFLWAFMAFISRDINLVWILKSSYQMRITGIECWFNIYDSSIVIMNLDRDKVQFSTYITNLMFSSNIFSNLCLVISILKTEWLSLCLLSTHQDPRELRFHHHRR